MKQIVLFFVATLLWGNVFSQDIDYARSVINTLASPQYHGRGYVKGGDQKAARFVAKEFEKMGLKKYGDSYLQEFTMCVNTFPAAADLSVDGETLMPGRDFLLAPWSGSGAGEYDLIWLDTVQLASVELLRNVAQYEGIAESFLVLDLPPGASESARRNAMQIQEIESLGAAGVIVVEYGKLTFGVAPIAAPFPVLMVAAEYINRDCRIIHINIENKLMASYATANVIGCIEGQTDSAIVFTAHYDHLGQMGKDTYFPGAHDNASGTATMLDLAKTFAAKTEKPHYTMVFMAFAAEEAGLLGSEYYVNNPLFDLSSIRFLLNLDLFGSGEEGIQVVNGSVFSKEFELLQQINTENNYIKDVKTRGAAANSDHYHFYKQKVPCFFIYTLGEYKEYHNIKDTAEAVPLPKYNEIVRLLLAFVDKL